jgi:hypothetical protein
MALDSLEPVDTPFFKLKSMYNFIYIVRMEGNHLKN